MQKITAGLAGAAAVSASLLALRSPRNRPPSTPTSRQEPTLKGVHAGETIPVEISLERLRELGL
jgi:hypothetical protein